MAHSSATRRKLFMHPAHLTVGVADNNHALHPYCRREGLSTDRPAVAPPMLAALLAADSHDADAQTALSLLQRAIRQLGDVRCRRVDIDAVAAGPENLDDAHCWGVFHQGLQVARYWSDLILSADNSSRHTPCAVPAREACEPQMTVEIAAAARRHPVLEGVGPFPSRKKKALPPFVKSRAPTEGWPRAVPANGDWPLFSTAIPTDATVLLCGRSGDAVWPVCWVRRGRGWLFQTTLGSSADFRQPDFVRLVLNSLRWIGR